MVRSFQVMPGIVAVAGDRLVTIVEVNTQGTVTVRDLASGCVQTIDAADLKAPRRDMMSKVRGDLIIDSTVSDADREV